MKHKISSFFTALIALLAFGAFISAQDSAQTAPQAERQHKRGFGKHHRGGISERALSGLNLTEAQQQQVRAIIESQRSSTKALHDELKQIHDQKRQGATLTAEQENRAKTLHTQLEAANQKARADVMAVLTAEQRAQLEQMRGGKGFGKERGFGKGERGGMMRGFGRLNLTEAQQQQAKTIFENQLNSTKELRSELEQIMSQRRQGGTLTTEQQNRANELRTQLREAMTKAQAEFQEILTPEQRQQIEQNRGRFGERRRMRTDGETVPKIN